MSANSESIQGVQKGAMETTTEMSTQGKHSFEKAVTSETDLYHFSSHLNMVQWKCWNSGSSRQISSKDYNQSGSRIRSATVFRYGCEAASLQSGYYV